MLQVISIFALNIIIIINLIKKESGESEGPSKIKWVVREWLN